MAICPNVLSNGSCPDGSCHRNHDVYICRTCSITCPNQATLDAHFNGQRHRRQLGGPKPVPNIPHCSICESYVTGSWPAHTKGKRHLIAAKSKGVNSNIRPGTSSGDIRAHVFCSICKTFVHEDAWEKHPGTRLHQRKLRFGALEFALQEAAKDKHGVTVSSPDGLNFGVAETDTAREGVQMTLSIQNTVPHSYVILVEAKLSSATSKRGSS